MSADSRGKEAMGCEDERRDETVGIYVLARVTTDRQLRRVLEMTQDEGKDPRGGAPVYIRVNLHGHGEYVGYTEHWEDRVKRHHRQTCRHQVGAPRACRKCQDHKKYVKHRTARPHEWIMIQHPLLRELQQVRLLLGAAQARGRQEGHLPGDDIRDHRGEHDPALAEERE